MSVDLASEIQAAFAEYAESVRADPERMLAGLRKPSAQRTPRRPLLAVAASMIVVVAVAATVAALHQSLGRESSGLGGAPVAGPYPQWGVARGNLSDDPRFLETVRAEIAKPTGQENSSRTFAPSRGTGPLQILWAGNTPSGAAAVTAQIVREETAGADFDYVMVSMLATDTTGQLRTMHRNLTSLTSAAGLLTDIGFLASPQGRYLVVIPPHPTDRVQVTPHGAGSGNETRRTWSDVPVVNGAAVADIGAGNLGYDALFTFVAGIPSTGDASLPFPWDQQPDVLGGNLQTAVTVTAVGREGIAPADGNGLASGVCASPTGVVTFVLGGSPVPRCSYATGKQTVEAVNALDKMVRVRLGYQTLTLPPGARGRFRGPVGAFLAPGHHVLSDSGYKGGGAELVVRM